MDSASRWRVFSRITVPLLSPIIAYALVIALINAFKVYTEVYARCSAAGRVPPTAPSPWLYYIYQQFYVNWNFGIASAAAVVLFLIILVFTLLQPARLQTARALLTKGRRKS